MTPQVALAEIKWLLTEQLEATPENLKKIDDAIGRHSRQIRDVFFRALIRSEKDRRTPSASNLGKCTRQLAYKYHGIQGERIDYKSRLTFCYGDIVEVLLYILFDVVGAPVDNKQVSINEDGITGSPDGSLEDWAVDIKSMSAYAFKLAQEKGVDNAFGYETQLSIYTKALGKTLLGWFGICKDKGDIDFFPGLFKPSLVEIAKRKKEIVEQSTLDNLPARDYQLEADAPRGKASGKLKLAMQCKFCPNRFQCWNITEVAAGFNNSEVYYATGPNNNPVMPKPI